MTKIPNSKRYDFEERTYQFAEQCRDWVKQLPKTISNIEYAKQLIRASGSVASNYIEANEALSKRDFIHRVRIARKESKEAKLWLRLCGSGNSQVLERKQKELIQEADELRRILSAIIDKSL